MITPEVYLERSGWASKNGFRTHTLLPLAVYFGLVRANSHILFVPQKPMYGQD